MDFATTILTIVAVYTSVKFFTMVHHSDVERAAKLLRMRYDGIACPRNYTLYSLAIDGEFVSLQTLQPVHGHLTLQRCHSMHDFEFLSHGYQVARKGHVPILKHACAEKDYIRSAYDVIPETEAETEDTPGSLLPRYNQKFYDHDEDQAARTNESMASFIMKGIYPGTKWCGVGNMAHDIYHDLGEHPGSDECCRAHDLCRPNLEPFSARYHLRNPSIYSMLHCSCDVALYNCFRRVNTPVSREIGRIFFNLVKMKCFDFDMKEVCSFSLFGFCFSTETRCGAVLRDNPRF